MLELANAVARRDPLAVESLPGLLFESRERFFGWPESRLPYSFPADIQDVSNGIGSGRECCLSLF